MTDQVAVGVDGSGESMAAAEWAAREAHTRGAPLLMVCAAGHRYEGPLRPKVQAEREKTAQDILTTAKLRIAGSQPAPPVTDAIVSDPPARALLDAADDSALLVLGSRGLGALAGFAVGSVSLSVIAHTTKPVVTVRGSATTGDAVVVGLDFQQDCEPLLAFGFGVAARRGWKLRTVHTWSMSQMYGYPSALPDVRSVKETDAEATRRSHRMLAPWQRQYPDVRTEISTGSVAVIPHLLQLSADAGLLVVGRRTPGHPFPTRIGPVTHGVLHHAACAVAVVPHDRPAAGPGAVSPRGR